MLHIAWSVCLSACVMGKQTSCAKMVEPIEMPTGEPTHVDPKIHVLDGGEDRTNLLMDARGD